MKIKTSICNKKIVIFFFFVFSKILNKSTVQTFHLTQSFLIVITQEIPNVQEFLHDIFKVPMSLGLLNVNILIENNDAPMWSLFFYKPYIRSCNSIDVIKIETFSPDNYTNELNVSYIDLFPSRQFKFNHCPLYVSTFSIDPFVIIRNLNGFTTFDGLDVIIVNEIAKTLNLVPIFMLAPDKKNRGIIYPNGTATGAMKMVLDGTANLTVGSYALSLQRVNAMAYSKSYSQNSFIFAFKESVQLATPLARLMSPFQTNVWISITFLLIVSILVILLTKKLSMRQRHFIIGGQMNRTPILNMLNASIGNVIPNPMMTHGRSFGVFARTLSILWLFFWLIVRNTYQDSLYETLHSQRVKSPFDTIEKVKLSNVNIYIISTTIIFIPDAFNRAR